MKTNMTRVKKMKDEEGDEYGEEDKIYVLIKVVH